MDEGQRQHRDEIRQCRDEGRQIEALLPRAKKNCRHGRWGGREKQARELLLEMENCPVEAMFPYEEPEACDDIRKAAQGSSLCRPVPEEELENRLEGRLDRQGIWLPAGNSGRGAGAGIKSAAFWRKADSILAKLYAFQKLM